MYNFNVLCINIYITYRLSASILKSNWKVNGYSLNLRATIAPVGIPCQGGHYCNSQGLR